MNKFDKYYLKKGKLELSILDEDEYGDKSEEAPSSVEKGILKVKGIKTKEPRVKLTQDIYNVLQTMGEFLTKPESESEKTVSSAKAQRLEKIASSFKVQQIELPPMLITSNANKADEQTQIESQNNQKAYVYQEEQDVIDKYAHQVAADIEKEYEESGEDSDTRYASKVAEGIAEKYVRESKQSELQVVEQENKYNVCDKLAGGIEETLTYAQLQEIERAEQEKAQQETLEIKQEEHNAEAAIQQETEEDGVYAEVQSEDMDEAEDYTANYNQEEVLEQYNAQEVEASEEEDLEETYTDYTEETEPYLADMEQEQDASMEEETFTTYIYEEENHKPDSAYKVETNTFVSDDYSLEDEEEVIYDQDDLAGEYTYREEEPKQESMYTRSSKEETHAYSQEPQEEQSMYARSSLVSAYARPVETVAASEYAEDVQAEQAEYDEDSVYIYQEDAEEETSAYDKEEAYAENIDQEDSLLESYVYQEDAEEETPPYGRVAYAEEADSEDDLLGDYAYQEDAEEETSAYNRGVYAEEIEPEDDVLGDYAYQETAETASIYGRKAYVEEAALEEDAKEEISAYSRKAYPEEIASEDNVLGNYAYREDTEEETSAYSRADYAEATESEDDVLGSYVYQEDTKEETSAYGREAYVEETESEDDLLGSYVYQEDVKEEPELVHDVLGSYAYQEKAVEETVVYTGREQAAENNTYNQVVDGQDIEGDYIYYQQEENLDKPVQADVPEEKGLKRFKHALLMQENVDDEVKVMYEQAAREVEELYRSNEVSKPEAVEKLEKEPNRYIGDRRAYLFEEDMVPSDRELHQNNIDELLKSHFGKVTPKYDQAEELRRLINKQIDSINNYEVN